jgi:hypothetical protein
VQVKLEIKVWLDRQLPAERPRGAIARVLAVICYAAVARHS